MKNSVSDQSFYIHSEDDEDDEEKASNNGGDDEQGNNSDSSSSSDRDENPPNSYNTTWPQSYRQSIDMYSSVASPNIGFLGTPTLSRMGSSFFASTLTRRHTPEVLPTSLVKPLINQEQHRQKQEQRRSSHSLLPPRFPHKKTSIYDVDKGSIVEVEPVSRQCSYGQSVLNGINALCGVGILSTPNAVKEGGWAGLSVLFIFAILSFYTGILLRRCLDSEPGLKTYPDIGQAAFGTKGRIIISIILYVELYACCVEYIILEGDNLSSLFPNAHLSILGIELTARHLFALMACLAVLPTVWLRDLSVLSYISAGGVIASVLVVICLSWVGLVDDVGFQSKGSTLNLTTLPVAIGLYGYCYSGHAVFPNIYSSMAKPAQFAPVLLTCFIIVTILYAGAAVMGYAMFADAALSQFTLNMPQNLVASKIAVWTTVINPFTKYALTMTPVALSLEELIPPNQTKSYLYSVLIRTALVVSTLLVGLTIPFFGLVMALIGSSLTMLVTFICPCACFLSILKGKVTRSQVAMCTLIIVVGAVSSTFGTISALSKIIQSLS
ncbi:Amino acid transporter avt1c [Ranunculus cassubicifolius]